MIALKLKASDTIYNIEVTKTLTSIVSSLPASSDVITLSDYYMQKEFTLHLVIYCVLYESLTYNLAFMYTKHVTVWLFMTHCMMYLVRVYLTMDLISLCY